MPDLTDEEIATLQEKAAKVESLESEKAEALAKLKEAEEDENNKDWRRARNRIKSMEEALEKQGKVVDPITHEVKTVEQEFSPEDVDKRADEAVERGWISKALTKAQRDLSDEDKAIFNKFYKKATFEEQVTSDNVDDFISLAFKLGGSGAESKTLAERAGSGRGGAPRIEKPSEDFSQTDAGQKVLQKMFPSAKIEAK